ncbi:MAG: TRAP transporter fused permease subunit, partial [Chloroflexota bacterium]
GVFGSTLHLVATIILAFIIFGAFLQASGAARIFIDLALAVAGRYRGGPAKVAIVASALFGTINGSTLANIATTGTVTIPLMKSIGYKPSFAGAVEAVASNGGPITPPVMGASIFLMMDFLGVSYVRLMAMAALPALLYYLGLMVMVDHRAVRDGLKGLAREQMPPLKKALADSWFCLIPFAVIIFMLVFLHFSPATSAMAATAALVLASLFKKSYRMGPRKLGAALAGASQGLPEVGTAVAIAGILMGSFNITGVGLTIAQELVALSGGNLAVLVGLITVACLVLGMGLSGIAVYLLAAMLLAPALVMLNVPPLAAHFFVLWIAHAALITPPVCPAAFLGGAIAGAPLMETGWQACRLGIVVYLLPFIWVYDPALLWIGSPGHIAFAMTTAIAGVYFTSCGVSGLMLKLLRWWERLLLLIGGILLLIPGGLTDLTALAVVAVPVVRQLGGTRLVPAWLGGRR